jgi:DNA-binding PadR family transcriptional regulator
MEKPTLKLLEYLENIFPRDLVTDSSLLASLGTDVDTITTLERNKLIEKVPRGTPNISSAISYRITSLGIQFLNQARQKRTNELLLTLTIIFTLFSLAQVVLMFLK